MFLAVSQKFTPTPTPVPSLVYIENVPFSSQAPFGNWTDPRQQDGCEETASLIAVSWAMGENLNQQQALDQIIDIAEYQKDKYGSFTDTSLVDTQKRIIEGYFHYSKSRIFRVDSVSDLINKLNSEQVIIVPTNGRLLGNPNFTPPGPERHNLVIIGYDYKNKEFITHDPGTRKGKNYRYPEDMLFNSIRDYPTGEHLPIIQSPKSGLSIFR